MERGQRKKTEEFDMRIKRKRKDRRKIHRGEGIEQARVWRGQEKESVYSTIRRK
jgi:hypothetical protein